MIILIAIVPMRFALDHTKDPVILQVHIRTMHSMLAQVDTVELAATDKDRIQEDHIMHRFVVGDVFRGWFL